MKKIFLLSIILLLATPFLISQLADVSSGAPQKVSDIAKQRELLDQDPNIPDAIKDGFKDTRFTTFSYERKKGVTTITYEGEAGQKSIKDNARGIEFGSRYNSDGSEASRLFLQKGSSLSYKDGQIVSADINVPVSCDTGSEGGASGACPPNAAKGEGYELGGYNYPAAPGAKVKYRQGTDGKPDEVTITQTIDGTPAYKPTKIDPKTNDPNPPKVTYKLAKDSKSLKLDGEYKLTSEEQASKDVREGDKLVEAGTKDIGLSYDPKLDAFLLSKSATIDGVKTIPLADDIQLELAEVGGSAAGIPNIPGSKSGKPKLYFNRDLKTVNAEVPKGSKGLTLQITKDNKFGIPVGKNLFTGEETTNGLLAVRVATEGTNYKGETFSGETASLSITGSENPIDPPIVTIEGPASVLNGNILFSTDTDLSSVRYLDKTDLARADFQNFVQSTFGVNPEKLNSATTTPILHSFKDAQGNEIVSKDPTTGAARDLYTSVNGDFIKVHRGTTFDEEYFNRNLAINYLDQDSAGIFRQLTNDQKLDFLRSYTEDSKAALVSALAKLRVTPKTLEVSMPKINQDTFGSLIKDYGLGRVDIDGDPRASVLKTSDGIGGIEVYNADRLNDPNAKVYVKVGTEWCGPCKLMDKDIRGEYASGDSVYIIINFQNENQQTNSALEALSQKYGFDGGNIPQTFIFDRGIRKPIGAGYQKLFR